MTIRKHSKEKKKVDHKVKSPVRKNNNIYFSFQGPYKPVLSRLNRRCKNRTTGQTIRRQIRFYSLDKER